MVEANLINNVSNCLYHGVSSITFKSVFNIVGQTFGEHRTSLAVDKMQALIYLSNWCMIQKRQKSLDAIDIALRALENLEVEIVE